MSQQDYFTLIGIGGLFILLGIGAIIWGRREEKGYYDAISSRPDAREFMDRWPQRPQFGALQIGGWISITIGALMVITGGAFWLWG